jgi:hypothetical protein
MDEPGMTLDVIAAWLKKYDLASKQEGWLLTNDSEDRYSIARIDDPQASIEDGWPLDFSEPKVPMG